MRRHWMPFGVLFVVWSAFLLSFVDRLTWPPIIPLASRDLGISAAQAGGYMTAFYIGYVMTQLPGGYLTDRFGYRKVLLTSFLVMGTFTAAMGLVENYAAGFLLRILAGMGSGAVFSAGVRAIFDWFRQNSRATAMGFFMTASSLGPRRIRGEVPVRFGWVSCQWAGATGDLERHPHRVWEWSSPPSPAILWARCRNARR